MKSLSCIILVLVSILSVNSQTIKIEFYQFNNNNDTIMQNKTLYINNDFYRMDVRTVNYQSSIIENFNTDTLIVLIHHQKIYSYQIKGDVPPKKLSSKIKTRCRKKETKNVLGYQCHKCRITEKWKADNETRNLEVWYTTDIKNLVIKKELDFKDVPGIVLEVNNLDNHRTTRAVSIYKTDDDTINIIPEGYTLF